MVQAIYENVMFALPTAILIATGGWIGWLIKKRVGAILGSSIPLIALIVGENVDALTLHGQVPLSEGASIKSLLVPLGAAALAFLPLVPLTDKLWKSRFFTTEKLKRAALALGIGAASVLMIVADAMFLGIKPAPAWAGLLFLTILLQVGVSFARDDTGKPISSEKKSVEMAVESSVEPVRLSTSRLKTIRNTPQEKGKITKYVAAIAVGIFIGVCLTGVVLLEDSRNSDSVSSTPIPSSRAFSRTSITRGFCIQNNTERPFIYFIITEGKKTKQEVRPGYYNIYASIYNFKPIVTYFSGSALYEPENIELDAPEKSGNIDCPITYSFEYKDEPIDGLSRADSFSRVGLYRASN